MAATKNLCLGGGSLCFARALLDLVLGDDLGGSEIVLYEYDGKKVELLARRGGGWRQWREPVSMFGTQPILRRPSTVPTLQPLPAFR